MLCSVHVLSTSSGDPPAWACLSAVVVRPHLPRPHTRPNLPSIPKIRQGKKQMFRSSGRGRGEGGGQCDAGRWAGRASAPPPGEGGRLTPRPAAAGPGACRPPAARRPRPLQVVPHDPPPSLTRGAPLRRRRRHTPPSHALTRPHNISSIVTVFCPSETSRHPQHFF